MNKIRYWWDTVIANLIQGRGSDSAYNKHVIHTCVSSEKPFSLVSWEDSLPYFSKVQLMKVK